MLFLRYFALCLGICVLSYLIGRNDASALLGVVVLGTAIWAAVESAKLRFVDYKSMISTSPGAVFVCMIMLWIVTFPIFLATRHKILRGQLPLKNGGSVPGPRSPTAFAPPPLPNAETQWLYVVNGQQFGPVSEAALRELVANGKISQDTLVWTQGMQSWVPAVQVLAPHQPSKAA